MPANGALELAWVRLCLVTLVLISAAELSSAQEGRERCRRPVWGIQVERSSPTASVRPHETLAYAVEVTNRAPMACGASTLLLQVNHPAVEGFRAFTSLSSLAVAPGEARRTLVSITATHRAVPGRYDIALTLRDTGRSIPPVPLPIELTADAACAVDPLRELFIHDTSVVDDPKRTSSGPGNGEASGAWTFRRLMEQASPEPSRAPAVVRAFLETWQAEQHVNGFPVPARPAMERLVLAPWARGPGEALDLARAPFRLLAIVARLDLRDLEAQQAGELRFVFGLLGPAGHPLPFTLIFEYGIPARSEAEVRRWAEGFHELGTLPFPGESYNARLQSITDAVTRAGAAPDRTNGSALRTLRTNENALDRLWELREFRLSRETGGLEQTPVTGTPDVAHQNQAILATYINQHEEQILGEAHDVPGEFLGERFQGGAIVNLFTTWGAPGIRSAEARRRFSLNTCDGCHGSSETGTEFVHVKNRKPGMPSELSGFLMGITLEDPVTGEPRTFNELGRRKRDLEGLLCGCPDSLPCARPEPTPQAPH